MTLNISIKRGEKESITATVEDSIGGDQVLRAGNFYVLRRHKVSRGPDSPAGHLVGSPRRSETDARKRVPSILVDSYHRGPIDIGNGIVVSWNPDEVKRDVGRRWRG